MRRGQSNGDGEYLIPSNIRADSLISFGLGDNWKFENDLVKSGQDNNFIVFDHFQNLFNYVKQVFLRIKLRNFKLDLLMGRVIVLLRYFIDLEIVKKKYIKKKISKNRSFFNSKSKFDEINVSEIFQEFIELENIQIFFKNDIEGAKYKIIEQIMNHSKQIKIIIIEFHNIIENAEEFEKLLRLLKSKYSLIHTHINNNGAFNENMILEICEFTFINNLDFTKI